LFLRRDRFRTTPVVWVLLLVSAALGLVLYRVPVVMGYLSDRHTVLILFCGVFWTAAGVLPVGDFLADWCRARSAAWGRAGGVWCRRSFWTTALLVPLIAAALVKTLEPLHTDRLPYREAGHWLAEHAPPGADIDDPYSWASYYAGRLFTDDAVVQPPPAHVCYVVIEKFEGDRHSNRPPHTNPDRFRDRTPVWTAQVPRAKVQSQVMVFEVPE